MAPKAAFASASAAGGALPDLIEGISARALADLGPGDAPDLAVLFVTPDFGESHADAGPRVRKRTGARHLLGCSGGGVIGSEAEREEGRAASLLLARLGGADLRPFRVVQEDLAEPDTDPAEFHARIAVPAGGEPSFLLLADPFTVDGEALLDRMNQAWPGRPVLGGLASGASRHGIHALWLDDAVEREGAVALAISGGELALRPLVSQGCRPVGRRFTVTRAEGPRLFQLAGRPAVDALKETMEALSPEDRELARTSLHIGRVAHEARSDFHRGDFLIRNIVAIVPEDGSLVVGDELRPGQTVQFQLRDAATATEDLGALLDLESASPRPAGGLLFSCGGRGSHLFGKPDHDLDLVRGRLGPFPIAGFFCNGEIGPVGPMNFLHGFTSSLALFVPRATA